MTPDQISSIIGALDRLETKIDNKADRSDIRRLEGKVDRTNGRVTDLERKQIVEATEDRVRHDVRSTIWKATASAIAAGAGLAAIGTFVITQVT